jgi:TolA-binding protein
MEGTMSQPKHTITIVYSILAFAALLLAACAQAAAPEMAPGDFGGESFTREAAGEFAPDEASFVSDQSLQDIERLVIQNADLSVVVPDPAASMDRISAMADEMGGFVVTANLYTQQLESGVEVPRANITIRVPAERLTDALQRIRQESDQTPLNESINSEDVTSDYTDLQSRLRNLEQAEEQLRQIMEDATKTEDVLSVYNELVQVREEIEVIKGRMQYLEQSAALSAISVQLIANEAVQPLTIGGWQPGGVAKQAVQALINAFKYIIDAAIWVLIFVLPTLLLLLVIFVLPIYLVVRAWRRRRRARAQSAQTAEQSQTDLPAE